MSEPSVLEIRSAQQAWWDQNKRWFLSVLIGVPVLVTVVGFSVGLMYAGRVLWGSEVAVVSLEMVKGSAEVVDLLGEPIEAGWFIQGTVDEAAGLAEMRYVVRGPKADGGVRVKGEVVDGVWVVTGLDVGVGEGVVVVDTDSD
ncbi:MAG: cytochrome c oxidase assembly factor Coa1 family protein [Phycisphaeraceae bacterium]